MPSIYGLPNVISALNRSSGISAKERPDLYEACYRNMKEVREHLAIEGMKLLHNPNQGLFTIICMNDDEIEEMCQAAGREPFRPVWSARSLDYHTSVVATILSRRCLGAGGDEDAVAVDDALREFETFLPEGDRRQPVKVAERFQKSLDTLVTHNYAEWGKNQHGEDTVKATGWLNLKMTVSESERFAAHADRMFAHHDENEETLEDDE